MKGFPVGITQSIVADKLQRCEGTHIYPCVLTQMGVLDAPTSGNHAWATQTPATITANTMTQINNLKINPKVGRIWVIQKIIVDCTADCTVHLLHKPSFYRLLYNSDSGVNGSIQSHSMIKRQTNTAGGEIVFDFTANPLYLRSDEFIQFYYMRSVTTGCNFKVEVVGHNITADENYTANKTMLVLGDSTSGVEAELAGIQTGLWPFIIRNNYLAAGKNVRVVNIAQNATTAAQWKWYVDFGRLEYFYGKIDIAFINLGMNDCDTSMGAGSTTTLFKTALKNIAAKIHQLRPDVTGGIPIVFNGISWTNTSTRTANLSSYRQAVSDAVTELIALGINAKFVDMSTLDSQFSTNPTTNGYFVETSANSQLHPSAGTPSITGGQTLIAGNIWTVVQNLI